MSKLATVAGILFCLLVGLGSLTPAMGRRPGADINPVQNPYVRSDGSASPEKGARYADRSQDARGLIHDGGGVVRAFSKVGWSWGGYWSSAQDYQHFSATGH